MLINHLKIIVLLVICDSDSNFAFDYVNGTFEMKEELQSHYAQIFAMWEANTYSVEFNVNYGKNDSTIANFTQNIYNMSSSALSSMLNTSNLPVMVTTDLIGTLNDVYNTTAMIDELGNDYRYDLISLEFNKQVSGSDFKYVAYVEFDTDNWKFKTANGEEVSNALYYILVQKFGYYFKGWYTSAGGNNEVIAYYEDEGEENKILGEFRDELPEFNYDFFELFSNKTREANETAKYGIIVDGDWIENRETETFQITLYAKWENKVYTLSFNPNDVTDGNGSSKAMYSVNGSNYDIEKINDLTIKIVFDTSNYYLADSMGDFYLGNYLEKILIDRYGYTWKGWTLIKSSTPDRKLIDGHRIDGMSYSSGYTTKFANTPKFDYQLRLKAIITITENVDGEITNYRVDSLNQTDKILNVYADWEANDYYLNIDFCDVNSGIEFGSSEARYKYSETFTTIVVTFDTVCNEIENLIRNGYTFVGWIFGENSDKEDRLLSPESGFILSDEYIHSKDGSKVYLYTSRECTNDVSEKLGDNEGLNRGTEDISDFSHFVICYAQWEVIEYSIKFDSNKNNGSTTPLYAINSNIYDKFDASSIEIRVKFDTDDYYLVDSYGNKIASGNNFIEKVLIDRYGYSWLGWYVLNLLGNENMQVIAGNSDATRQVHVFDNDLFTFIFAEYNYESLDDEEHTTITLYAEWQANEYSIVYDYSDKDSDRQYYANSINRGLGITQNSDGGSTNAWISGILVNIIDHLKTATFDLQNNTLNYSKLAYYLQLKRTGYIFNGWKLAKDGAVIQENYAANGSLVQYFNLNSEYSTSVDESDIFLYYFVGTGDATDKEKLGDADFNEEHMIVLYADWTARTYEVEFEFNNGYTMVDKNLAATINNSTSANSLVLSGLMQGISSYKVYVQFDTNNWYAVDLNGSDATSIVEEALKYITTERIGYEFLGWYTTRTMNVGSTPLGYISSLIYEVDGTRILELTNEKYDSNSSTEVDGYLTEEQKAHATGTVKLFAAWKQLEYSAELHLRDNGDYDTNFDYKFGSTTAYLQDFAGNYNMLNVNFDLQYVVKVLFDSNEYIIYRIENNKLIKLNETLYSVLVDRYGYKWTGWYVQENASLLDFNNSGIVEGHTYSDVQNADDAIINMALTRFDFRIYSQAKVVREEIGANIDEDLTFNLFAGWQANIYDIVYDLNDRDGINNPNGSSKAEFGEHSTSIEFDKSIDNVNPTRKGYTFVGWCLTYQMLENVDAGVSFEHNRIITLSETIQTSFFPPEYRTIIFYNGNLLLYSDYISDSESVDSKEELGDIDESHKIVLIAKWATAKYLIEFDSNDSSAENGSTSALFNNGSGYIDNKFMTDVYIEFEKSLWFTLDGNNESVGFDANNVKLDRFGYTLVGWSTIKYSVSDNVDYKNVIFNKQTGTYITLNDENINQISISDDGTANLTLYAVWKANEYTLQFSYNDFGQNSYQMTGTTDLGLASGVGSSPANGKYLSTYKMKFDGTDLELRNLSRVGYTFYGYSIGSDLENSYIFLAGSGSTSRYTNISLNAETIKLANTDEITNLWGEYSGAINYEQYGDQESANYVKLFALWTPNVYSVTLDYNTSKGSTNAYFLESNGLYSRVNISERFTISVVFDTNNWNWTTSSDFGYIDSIEVGRFGYLWSGWYAEPKSTNAIYLTGTIGNDRLAVFDYSLHDLLAFASAVSEANKSVTLFAGWNASTFDVEINNNEIGDKNSLTHFFNELGFVSENPYRVSVGFDTNSWTNLDKIKMDRYGYVWNGLWTSTENNLKIEETTMFDLSLFRTIFNNDNDDLYLLNNYTNNIIELFAHWTANDYTVHIMYYDVRMGHGSSKATELTSYISSVKFTDEFTYSGLVQRTGYNFKGFVLGTDQERFVENDAFIFENFGNIFDYNYLSEFNNMQLYYDIDGTSFTEELGDIDAGQDHHIYIYTFFEAINYKISFNKNDNRNNNGSTTAYHLEGGNYVEGNGLIIETDCFVTFDSSSWNGLENMAVDRIGYNFKGWFSSTKSDALMLYSSDSTLEINNSIYALLDISDTSDVEGQGTLMLYAGWQAKVYSIKYTSEHSNDALENIALKSLTFDQTYTAPLLNFKGYEFVGWTFGKYEIDTSTPNSTGKVVCSLAVIVVDSDKVTFTFGYYPYSDDSFDESFGYDNRGKYLFYGMDENLGRDRYFLYKSENVTGENSAIIGDQGGETPYVEMTAVWKPRTYDIVFDLNDSTSTSSGKVGSTKAYFSNDRFASSYENYDYNNNGLKITVGIPYSYLSTMDGHSLAVDRYGYTWTGWYFDSNATSQWLCVDAYADQNFTLLVSMVERLISEGIIDADDTTLTLYAGWRANAYSINYITNANGGSSNQYAVSDDFSSEDIQSAIRYNYNIITPQQTLTFDQPFKITYMRAGYTYLGYSFINYKYYNQEMGGNLIENYAINSTILGASSIFGDKGVYLYGSEQGSAGLTEMLGDFENEQYFIEVYLGWSAIEYQINISLNTLVNDTAINNFGSVDAGYAVGFRNNNTIYNLANNAVLAYTTDASNYLTFAIKFDENFQDARTVSAFNGRYYTLGELLLKLNGYSFDILTTRYDETGIQITSSSGSVLDVEFDYDMLQSLIYQTVIRSGNTLFSSYTSMATWFNASASTIQRTISKTRFGDTTFTLFAHYQTNEYEISVSNSSNDVNENTGFYNLISGGVATGSGAAWTNKINFFDDKNVLIVPKTSGYYLSAINVNYYINNVLQTMRINLIFDSKSRMVVIDTIYVGGETITGDSLLSFNVPYVFDGIEVTSFLYGMSDITVDNMIINGAIAPDVNFVNVLFKHIKTDISITCEYSKQMFETLVYINISTDGKINIESDQNIASREYHEYGDKVSLITSKWDNMLMSSGCTHVGWFKIIYNDNGTYGTFEFNPNDSENIVNENLVLCSSYLVDSDSGTRRIMFYTWSGGETGTYAEYVNNNFYIIQSTSYTFDEKTGTLSAAMNGLVYNNGWKWTEGYTENAKYFDIINSGTEIVSATLSNGSIPNISTKYPGSESICFIVMNSQYIKDNLGYDYISQLTGQSGVYARVIDYYRADDGKIYADVIFDALGGGKVLKGVEVLTTSTEIDENLFALQAYGIRRFTIETKEDLSSDMFALSANNLTFKVSEFLQTVSYFELDSNSVSYYSEASGDFVQFVKLNALQFESFMLRRASGSSISTALKSVLDTYAGIEITALSHNDSQININVNDQEFLFMFYYKHGSNGAAIISVCDMFIKVDGNSLKYYRSTNNLSFTNGSVSYSQNANETIVRIDKDRMNTEYVDYDKISYSKNELKFVVLSTQIYTSFIEYSSSQTKELALKEIMNEFASQITITTSTTLTFESNAYIIGFYENENGEIVEVTTGQIYVNAGDHSARVITAQDLMFTDDYSINDNVSNITGSTFDFTISTDTMFTNKYDYSTGTNYDHTTNTLRFVAMNASQFKYFSDFVANGLKISNDALKFILENNENYHSVVSVMGKTATFAGLLLNTKYFIVAFYTANEGTANESLLISVNELTIVFDEQGSGTLQTDLITLSNNFSFQSSVISSVEGSNARVTFISENMKQTYVDYVTGNRINNISYIELTLEEIRLLYNYYYNGVRITNTSNSNIYRDYNNLTLEEALELVIYYNRYPNEAVQNLLASNTYESLSGLIENTTLSDPTISEILPSENLESSESRYVIAVNMTTGGVIQKVSSNVVKINFAKRTETSVSTTIELVTINNLFVTVD